MVSTLVIKPLSGTFLKDVELFSKQDPFVKVSVGTESQKTEVAHNAGKNPTWKATLSFKLTQQQYQNSDNVLINFETFDDEGTKAARALGSGTIKLSQVQMDINNPNRPQSTRIPLYDNKKKEIGSIEVRFDFQNYVSSGTMQSGGFASQQTMGRGLRHSKGTLIVKPLSGRFDSGVQEQEEIYLVAQHGDVSYQSMISEGNGKRPIFRDIITFQLFDGADLQIKCYDNDIDRNDLIGECVVPFSTLSKIGKLTFVEDIPVFNTNRRMGDLKLEIEYLDEFYDQLVKVYPTQDVRKNEPISKKIRYNNPDRFKKNVTVRSQNKNLVVVKNETLSIQPNDFGEIKFQFFSPQNRGVEERCRVEILLEDNTVEEVLIFKIRAI